LNDISNFAFCFFKQITQARRVCGLKTQNFFTTCFTATAVVLAQAPICLLGILSFDLKNFKGQLKKGLK
jgi:hypothetical protein